jgi:hypothetical protein
MVAVRQREERTPEVVIGRSFARKRSLAAGARALASEPSTRFGE